MLPRREEFTAGLVRELTLYLEAARVDPGLTLGRPVAWPKLAALGEASSQLDTAHRSRSGMG